mmetsp:Transcript_588/g.2149  ORF Transcript_588/g.2149 Transcript_588/m.2149 type:complete len:255 (+) Transcript_588:959-1723(+)
MENAHLPCESALHQAHPASPRRADEPLGHGGCGLAGGLLGQLEPDPADGLPLARLHEQRVHAHRAHPRPETDLLHGQLRRVRPDAQGARGASDEAVSMGAGGDSKDEGVHRPLRSRYRQAGAASSKQGEGAAENAPIRPHREAKEGEKLELPFPGPRQHPATGHAGEQRLLRLPRQRPSVLEPRVRHRPGQPRCASRAERCRQVDAFEAFEPRVAADRRRDPPARASQDQQVYAAFPRCSRSDGNAAGLYVDAV